ncbi:hypothetical protein [Paenibacillus sp. IHBB 3054]
MEKIIQENQSSNEQVEKIQVEELKVMLEPGLLRTLVSKVLVRGRGS